MKRLIIFISLIFFGLSAHSQVLISLVLGDKLNTGKIEFGLDGGLNLVNINGAIGSKDASRFNLGFYFDFKLKHPSWMFHTGVIVKSSMGAENITVYSLNDHALDSMFTNGRIERTINYFNVPFMMKYKLSKSFYTEGGIMLGLRTTAHDVFKQTIKDKDDFTYELAIGDQLHRIDAGVIGGVGYRLMGGNGMNLGIRYYLGLMGTYKDDNAPRQNNQVIYFVVGIPIGAGKAAAAREEKKK